ncbi:hypothetical protein [Pontibacter harenae]|uniref:hypothetical protein n=1 Tax=Pontibacter harenae TaxID=2894083 RepID=UPI001E3353A7|nr:hypothetical protein [Pontibacter harenae]MCC9168734.1 hypothetical protein [Pontibacter harenae]
MTKRILFFFIGFVVLASLAYYGFGRWQSSREKVDLWELVPENAAFVVETNNHNALLEHLRQTDLLESISVLPSIQKFQENMAWLDSIAPGNERLSRFLDNKNILTSAHIVEASGMEFVYYVPVSTVGEHRFVRTLTENIEKSRVFSQESHDYQGYLVTDVTNSQLEATYSFFSYHNNIILSASPLLIEEIIRRLNRENITSITADFKNTNYLDQPDVYANVFVNYRVMPDLMSLFMQDDIMPEIRYLSSLCRNGMLQLKLEPNRIFVNGFSNPETLSKTLYSRLQQQKPKPLHVKAYLPTRTAVLLHFGAAELARLRVQPRKIKAEPTYTATLDSLASSFSEEAAIAYMESDNVNAKPEKIVYMRMVNAEATTNLLSELNRQVSAANKQEVSGENYGSSQLLQINIPDLPALLFGTPFSGFKECYAVQVEDYMIFASEVATLRKLLDDIASDNVWAKSVQQQAFLEETLQEANFSIFINTVNAWYVMSRYMTESSREDLLQNASLIKRFNQVSLQFSSKDQQYYTSLLFRRQGAAVVATNSNGFSEDYRLTFNNRLVSKPMPVQNAIDKSLEVVVADSANVLHNITAGGKAGWRDTLNSGVISNIKQITYGPDNRLYSVFATSRRIHALDNQGKSLVNFPFNLGDTLRLQHLGVFDYEKNGNYRLLADDHLGNLYMYDIRGNSIQGWQGLRMDYKLAAAPRHIRVGGLDVILIVLENGYVYALNPQGETYPGFPISLRSAVASDVFAKEGADLRRTEVTTVTRYGEAISFNLQGRILRRQQLPRPSKRALFEMVLDDSERSYIVVRQEQGRVTVYNQELKDVFEKRYVTSAAKLVQYFHFGGDKKIYAITELGPQKTYLYNAEAKLIGGRSLESSQPVTVYFNDATNNYSLFKVYRREMQRLNFRLGN